MKITLSKSQWEKIGKKAGWVKKAQSSSHDARILKACAQFWDSIVELEKNNFHEDAFRMLIKYFSFIKEIKPNTGVSVETLQEHNAYDAEIANQIGRSKDLDPTLKKLETLRNRSSSLYDKMRGEYDRTPEVIEEEQQGNREDVLPENFSDTTFGEMG